MSRSKATKWVRVCIITVVATFLAIGACTIAAPAPAGLEMPASLPKLQGPVAVTTIGQSPGAMQVAMLLRQLKIQALQKDDLVPSELVGKGYKVLVLTMGTSLKGMGAAGVDLNSEINRCNALVAEARKQKMFVIGAQIEGLKRRTDDSDERSNKAVCAVADLLLTRKEIDHDSYFTNVAKQRKIPLMQTKEALDFKYALSVLFGVAQ